MLKLTTDKHEALRGLSATAELHVTPRHCAKCRYNLIVSFWDISFDDKKSVD